jgi:hypothetical protein
MMSLLFVAFLVTMILTLLDKERLSFIAFGVVCATRVSSNALSCDLLHQFSRL